MMTGKIIVTTFIEMTLSADSNQSNPKRIMRIGPILWCGQLHAPPFVACCIFVLNINELYLFKYTIRQAGLSASCKVDKIVACFDYMIDFSVVKHSKKSRARVGILKTPHGEVETPAFVGVATLGDIKTLTSADAVATGLQMVISNTFHLHLRPGEDVIAKGGGLNKFANLPFPTMTDSGGFQVFSLGFGYDLRISKIPKSGARPKVRPGSEPKNIKITDKGVHFLSPFDGRKIFLGPKESIAIQEKLGADIILAFDECPPPYADKKYIIESMVRTHNWAKICLDVKKSRQALYGIVQGSRFKDLRIKSARIIGSLPFDGFGVGGEFGAKKGEMKRMLGWVFDELPEGKPRHLLGVGYPEDILPIVKSGVDTFDCPAPTHYARRGTAFTSEGWIDLTKTVFLTQFKSLDKKCACPVCASYTRAYISHLIRAKEITGMKLLTEHNLYFTNALVAKCREEIKKGRI
jgi:queuine tRNA-ribosyltransferase